MALIQTTFGTLRQVLLELGLQIEETPGSTCRIDHPDSGLIFLMRPHADEELVWHANIAAIGYQLDARGVIEREDFEGLLRQASRPPGAPSVGRNANRRERISYGDLKRYLASLGLVARLVEGSHTVCDHAASGRVLIYPRHQDDDAVPSWHLASTGHYLDACGLVERERFEEWVRQRGTEDDE
jgi:hypothetical protein